MQLIRQSIQFAVLRVLNFLKYYFWLHNENLFWLALLQIIYYLPVDRLLKQDCRCMACLKRDGCIIPCSGFYIIFFFAWFFIMPTRYMILLFTFSSFYLCHFLRRSYMSTFISWFHSSYTGRNIFTMLYYYCWHYWEQLLLISYWSNCMLISDQKFLHLQQTLIFKTCF